MIDIAGQYNLYGSFNKSVKGLLDTTQLHFPELLPPFDINVQALKNICSITTTSPVKNPKKPISLFTKEVKLSTHLRYNYYDLVSNTANRNFISIGLNTSIPLRIFSKSYQAYHQNKSAAFQSQQQSNADLKWLEISNLIYEFKYKLKQFSAWEEKQRIQKETLRIHQGLHQIKDPAFQPIQALDALDAYYALELEKHDLLQQLYLKLEEIQVLLPNESVNRYLLPYQKTTESTVWLPPMDDDKFIYTRGKLLSKETGSEKIQIVVEDATNNKIIGDIFTNTPSGQYEVYFPKPGPYTYKVRIADGLVLKGDFVIPDAFSGPAFMDQNINIQKNSNGKFVLSIQNSGLDSIQKGIEIAQDELLKTQNQIPREDQFAELENNKDAENERQEQNEKENQNENEVEKQKQNEIEKQKALEIEKQKQIEIEKQKALEIEKQKQIEIEKEKALEIENQKQNEIEKQKALEIEKQKQIEIEKQKALEIEKQKQIEIQNENEVEKQKQIEIEKKKELEIEKQKQNEIEKQKALEIEKQKESQPSDTTSQNQELLDLDLAKDLNEIETNNNVENLETSGTYSLDLRAAHVIQWVMDGLKIDTTDQFNSYRKWKLDQLLKQYPTLSKSYVHAFEIDSLYLLIDRSNNERSDLIKELARLEFDNRITIQSLTTEINKNLKTDLKRRWEDFNRNSMDGNDVWRSQIQYLKNLTDSLIVESNFERTKAQDNNSPLVEKNNHLKKAFDFEMNANKAMQHLVMTFDSKAIFSLYSSDQVEFLRTSDDDRIRRDFKNSRTYLATTSGSVGETYYIKSSTFPKEKSVEKDFFYTVQIGAFKNTYYIEQWEDWETIMGEKTENGLTRVMIGKSGSSAEAEESKKKLKELGYKDSYIVLYNNGERLPIREILDGASKNDTTQLAQFEQYQQQTTQWNNGMYLWSKSYLNYSNEEIISDLEKWKVDHVILSPTTDRKNWNRVNSLILELQRKQIGVEWMIGNNKWLNAPIESKLDSISQQMHQWKIQVIHLDIEPHAIDDYKKRKDYYHNLYISRVKEASQFCKRNGYQLNLSIPLSYPEEVLAAIEPYVQQITLMAYENPSVDAIQRRSQEEVNTFMSKTLIAVRAKDYEDSLTLGKDLNYLKNWIPSHQGIIHDYNTYKQLSSNEKH
jgi:hypothetical protein